MSVLAEDLLVVQVQFVGLSVHLSPPPKVLSLVELYRSRKWNVLAGFSGFPAASSTTPPEPALVDMSQSPTSAAGVLACRLPSMAKPPAGETSGATPAGGGAAWTFNPKKMGRITPRRRIQDWGVVRTRPGTVV